MSKPTIAIWGLGCIGCTSAMAYAEAGCPVIGYDVDALKVKCLQEGILPIPSLEAWFGTRWADAPQIQVTSDVAHIAEAPVTAHLVCVPTERGGQPWGEPVRDVLAAIAALPTTARSRPLVLIESTLDLAMWGRLAETFPDLRLAVSPRRDWFVSHDRAHMLSDLTRIYSTRQATDAPAAEALLRLVCKDVRRVEVVETVILGKLIENTVLHLGATLAGELAYRYPQYDVRRAFEVAATHWRTPLFYPSAGIGGQCVPLAPRYLRRAVPPMDGLLELLDRSDDEQPRRVAEALRRWAGRRGPIVLLGLTYKADVPVISESPAVAMAQYLAYLGERVHIHEPYAEALSLPAWLAPMLCRTPEHVCTVPASAAVIVLHTPHRIYQDHRILASLDALLPGTVIIDQFGAWAAYRDAFTAAGLRYVVLGEPGWMGES